MFEAILLMLNFILKLQLKVVMLCQWIIYHSLVLLRNATVLISYLKSGTKTWIIMLIRLLVFTSILTVGWFHLMVYYLFNPLIIKNLAYGRGLKYRNLLDIYLPFPISNKTLTSFLYKTYAKSFPEQTTGTSPFPSTSTGASTTAFKEAPVIVFVTGGAWIIGYKLWSILVGRGFSSLGFLVICPDYRNFPQGSITDMMEDISQCIHWTHKNARRFGGDPNKIILSGQSAGAHICLTLIIREYLMKKKKFDLTTPSSLRSEKYPEEGALVKETELPAYFRDDQNFQENQRQAFLKDGLSNPSTPSVTNNISSNKTSNNKIDSKLDEATSININYNPNLEDLEQEFTIDNIYLDKSVENFSQNRNSVKLKKTVAIENNREKKPRVVEDVAPEVSQICSQYYNQINVEEEKKIFQEFNNLSKNKLENHSKITPVIPSTSLAHNPSLQPLLPSASSSQTFTNTISPLPILHIIKGYVGISGPYDLVELENHLHFRGLDSSILSWICHGDLSEYSPTRLLCGFLEAVGKKVAEFSDSNASTCPPTTTSSRSTSPSTSPAETSKGKKIEDDSEEDDVNFNIKHKKKTKRVKNHWSLWSSSYYLLLEIFGYKIIEEIEDDEDDRGEGDKRSDRKKKKKTNHFPYFLPETFEQSNVFSDLIPIALFHGDNDQSIPVEISGKVYNILKRHGAEIYFKIYEGWSHTDAILEGPMSGSVRIFKDVLKFTLKITNEERIKKEKLFQNLGFKQPDQTQSNKNSITPKKVQLSRTRSLSYDFYNKSGDNINLPIIDFHAGFENEKIQKLPCEDVYVSRTIANIARSVNPF